jgi:hypothetical protein
LLDIKLTTSAERNGKALVVFEIVSMIAIACLCFFVVCTGITAIDLRLRNANTVIVQDIPFIAHTSILHRIVLPPAIPAAEGILHACLIP